MGAGCQPHAMLADHRREDAAPHIPARCQSHVTRRGGRDQIIEDLVGNGLVKGAFVPVGPHVELEGLELHVTTIGNVVDGEVSEVGLARQGAQAGELGDLDVNLVVPLGLWLSKVSSVLEGRLDIQILDVAGG